MGGIVWNEWSRLMSLSASFIIFVGGIVGCFEPLPGFDAMRKLPVLYYGAVPILPIILFCLGLIVAAIEYPLFATDYLNSPRAYMPKVAFFIPVSVLSLLESQTVNGAVYLAIATIGYMMAIRADFKKQQQTSWGRMA
ncbi:hypothetical protein BGX21_000414 [Mortierella sp. AD011]|nr:hypothetical protein BGX20_010281 [Mortierella sp. AD010]KAF9401836.1 hypothetical protein BGX21_000414 [Mortierella sp. AD011]